MNLAIINNETNIVENVIVPPSGTDAYFLPKGFYGIEARKSDKAAIGDSYDKEVGKFIKPELPKIELIEE